MMKKYLMNGLAAMAVGLFAASCSKDVELSKTDIVSNAESALGVKIAANQDWNMINNVTARVTVNLGTGEDYTLYVYDKSPFDNNDAVYFTKQTVKDASITEVSLSLPSYLKEVYVSVFDSKGASVSRMVAVNDGVVLTVFGSALPDSYNITRSTTRGNAGINYTPTDGTHNANANEWADPQKSYGGWIVPDTLTAGQKERVRKYFQANPNLRHQDPQWRHFFVQQVYKGGTQQAGVSQENIAAADGQNVYNSDKMNELSVGEANIHINNFNGGSYGNNGLAYTNVLDSGYTANDAAQHSHKDQIMLMVNIDDTSCFGYYESGSGAQINDKWALVSASDIDTWAKTQSPVPGENVVDRWNRSFLGFDHALKYEKIEDAYLKDNGQVQYVKINQVAGNAPQYVWDGEKVLKISTSNNASRRAKAKRRAGETSVTLWSGNQEVSNQNAITATFSESAKDLLVPGNYLGVDFTVVKSWYNNEWSYGDYSDWRILFRTGWTNTVGAGSVTLNANSTNMEIQLTQADVDMISIQGLQVYVANHPVKFTRVYISNYSQANGGGSGTEQGGTEQGGGEQGNTEQGGNEQGNTEQGGNEQGGSEQGGNEQGNTQTETEYGIYDSEYIIVDGKMIPYLVSNTNQFAGVPLTHADSVITDSNMKISKEGKDCLNLPKFAAAVRGGYLPVNGSALKTWVKFKESDGYYSDWIVTITEAKRLEGETETHNVPPYESSPQIYTYAFEDTYMGDYDLNDVVLKVWEENSKLKIQLCASGASKSLYVYYNDSPLFQGAEVHSLLGAPAGKFVNTGAADGEKFYSGTPAPTEIDIPEGFDFSTAGFNIRWGNKTEAESIWLTTRSDSPIGVAPYAVCIPADWAWPLEWVKVSDAYTGFSSYAANPSSNEEWYKSPTEGKTYKSPTEGKTY